jgi:hypothetical protein
MTDIISADKGLVGNFQALLFRFGLLSEEVPGVTLAAAEGAVGDLISWFVIEVGGERTETKVEAGKYKSALFLLYLAQCAGSDTFTMTSEYRDMVSAYFDAGIVDDALSNPETKHTTVRQLLADGLVRITINRPDVA